tara:strand:- start:641 stop:937 length:297 start_codon:yes stop_codon:yes gene_type:complete
MKRKEGLNNKTDIYLKMNFNNNVELISSFFRDLEIKYPKNKEVAELKRAIFEIFLHGNNQDILLRQMKIDNSNIREEANLAKKELFEFKPIINLKTKT